jgi:hypothetical protein
MAALNAQSLIGWTKPILTLRTITTQARQLNFPGDDMDRAGELLAFGQLGSTARTVGRDRIGFGLQSLLQNGGHKVAGGFFESLLQMTGVVLAAVLELLQTSANTR